jgi:hypothetical protein
MSDYPRVPRHRLLLGLAVAAVCLSSCGAAGGAAPLAAPEPGCNVYDKLTEKIVAYSLNELAGPYPAVGDSATYLTRLYDSDGKQIGTVEGKANIHGNLPGGDVLEYSEEHITLPGGTIDTEGLYNLTKGLAQEWQFLPAIGTGGAYRNKLGRRSFQIVKAGADLNVKIELCPVK